MITKTRPNINRRASGDRARLNFRGTATSANMPPPTSMRWPGWAYQMRDQRLNATFARRPGSTGTTRTIVRYVSTSGNDANDGLSTTTPWKTLQKVSDYIQGLTTAQALTVAILFRQGDIWNWDTASYKTNYTSSVASGAGTTSVTLTAVPAVWSPQPGDSVESYNGATRLGAHVVVSWTAASKILVLDSATGGTCNAIQVNDAVLHNKPVYLGHYNDPALGSASRALPCFSRFNATLPSPWSSSVDRADANTNVFSCAYVPTTSVARVKQAGTKDFVLRLVSSLADCQTYEGTWYWAANVLYVHPFGKVLTAGGLLYSNPKDQSEVRFAVCEQNFCQGIDISDVDGAVVDGIWIDGWGAAQVVTTTYAGYAIAMRQTGTNRAVIKNCWGTNNNRHSIGLIGITSGGDICVHNCLTGWCNEGANYVFYQPNGGATVVLSDSKVKYANVGMATTAYSSGNAGVGASQAVYAHTASSSYAHACLLCIDCEEEPSQWQAQVTPSWNGGPAWTDPADCRAFFFGYRHKFRDKTSLDEGGSLLTGGATGQSRNAGALVGTTTGGNIGKTMHINCMYEAKFVKGDTTVGGGSDSGDLVFVTTTGNDVYLNCPFIVDFGDQASRDSSRKRGWFDSNSSKFHNCAFRFRGTNRGSVGFNRSVMGATLGTNTVIFNSTIWWDTDQNTTTNGMYLGNGADSTGAALTQLVNNAYINTNVKTGKNGYDSDTLAVLDAMPPSTRPSKYSPLHVSVANHAKFYGYDVEYDFFLRERGLDGKVTIGPYEAWGSVA